MADNPLYKPIPPHELDPGMAELELEPWKEKYYQDPRFDLDREEIAGWEGGEMEFLEAFQDSWTSAPGIPSRKPLPGETPPSPQMRDELSQRMWKLGQYFPETYDLNEVSNRLARLAAVDPGGDISIGGPPQQTSPTRMQWKMEGEEQWREALPGGVPSTPAGAMEESQNLQWNRELFGKAWRESMQQKDANRQRQSQEDASRLAAERELEGLFSRTVPGYGTP